MPTSPVRVLLVEDDELLRSSLSRALSDAGYTVQACPDAPQAVAVAAGFRPDLALLDVSLPGGDGFALARRLRRDVDLPVIFVTARDALPDRLAGFAAGGDDYVVKPFLTEELIARVRALLRRVGRESATLDLGRLVIDESAALVQVDGVPVALTATEFRLLAHLAHHRGRTLSKTQLLTAVWGYDSYDPNLVEVHVSALRRKLGAAGADVLTTVRGLGYVLRPAPGGEAGRGEP